MSHMNPQYDALFGASALALYKLQVNSVLDIQTISNFLELFPVAVVLFSTPKEASSSYNCDYKPFKNPFQP